ncbi:hypothetical protein TNIN_492591 [Trichonephila inaurata madagascariensis]|uniref:Uncharacterized protein n=1 Tax=Trichonephila inaurata madagascariensis TaxID=2747483 RepID=A0A8X7BPB8_9ARAC|nr:hypothetical protein TNIN_492591 [Trichonephila inaurata madagascariensis]
MLNSLQYSEHILSLEAGSKPHVPKEFDGELNISESVLDFESRMENTNEANVVQNHSTHSWWKTLNKLPTEALSLCQITEQELSYHPRCHRLAATYSWKEDY